MAKAALNFIKTHKFESITLFAILIFALILRLYRIDGYMTFLGDEGRDVRIVRNILKGDLAFIGPQTSVGNMYLGPFYYYLMTPALWLSNLDPVGPAILIVLLSAVGIFMTWYVGRRWFNPMTGLLAAFFTAISPVAIIYSRASWNPNPMPLIALLSMWFLYQFWYKKQYHYLVWSVLFFSLSLQLHYLGLLLAPVIGFYYLLEFRKTSDKKSLLKFTLYSLLVFLFTLIPLILFDIKHQGMNINAFKMFFTDRQTTVNINPANSNRFIPIVSQLVSEILLSRQSQYGLIGGILLFAGSVFTYFKTKNKPAIKLLLVWIFFAILGLGVYKQHVYAHYFGFVQPALFILLASILSSLFFSSLPGKIIAPSIFVYIIYLSFVNSPLNNEPNNQLKRTQEIVKSIIQESKDQPFNFGLIAKQNYDESYRYFLENWQAKMIRGEDKVVDQMFVVCEDGDKCQPLGNPQWQIAVFGIASIEKQWEIDGIRVYKLVHTNGK